MTEIGRVYGEALYVLCRDEGLSDLVLAEFATLETSMKQEPEFIRLLTTPAFTKAERCNIIDDSFRGHVQPYFLSFLKILTEKGYMRHFSDCYCIYRDCYNKDQNVLIVTATTAVALTIDQVKRLNEKLSKLTGKTVQLCNRIDDAVNGGVRLDYDGKCLNDTITSRIDSIRRLLNNTVL